MSTAPLQYKYMTNIHLAGVQTPMSSVFPSVEDVIINSRMFDMLDDAIASANKLVSELTRTLNVAAGNERYAMASEINPKFSNKQTVSTDWGADEIAKIWVYDTTKRQELPGSIHAISLTQLVGVPTPELIVH